MMMTKKILIGLALLQLSSLAQADEIFLMDDVGASPMPVASSQENAADSIYRIPFYRSSAKLGTQGKQIMTDILPRLKRAQKIIIQGRPDHAISEKYNEKTQAVAAQRAQTLKKMLVNAGISETRLFIEVLGETSYSDTPNIYNATIKVFDYAQNDAQFRSDANAVVSINSASKLGGIGKQQSVPASSVRKVLKTAMDNNLSAMDTGRLFESWVVVEAPMLANKKSAAANDAMIPITSVRRVLKVAIDSNLSAVDASRMFESWMAVEMTPAPTTSTSIGTRMSGVNEQRMAYTGNNSTVPVINATPRQTWHLDPAKTLRDNLSDWSRQSGWAMPQWKATNNYQVTSAADFEGDLTDALRQVSERAKLNICITHAQKNITITDSNVSCKE